MAQRLRKSTKDVAVTLDKQYQQFFFPALPETPSWHHGAPHWVGHSSFYSLKKRDNRLNEIIFSKPTPNTDSKRQHCRSTLKLTSENTTAKCTSDIANIYTLISPVQTSSFICKESFKSQGHGVITNCVV